MLVVVALLVGPLGCLPTVGSSKGQRRRLSVFLDVADLLQGLQTLGLSEEQSSSFLVCSCSPARLLGYGVCCPVSSRTLQDFSDSRISCPTCSGAPGKPSDCVVRFQVPLCAEEFLRCLQAVVSFTLHADEFLGSIQAVVSSGEQTS